MYMMNSFGRGDIVFVCDTYYIVKEVDEENRIITIIQLSGELAGFTFKRNFDEFSSLIDAHYLGLGDFITSLGENQKKKLSKLREEIFTLNDEYGELKEEMGELWSIISFKNDEIIRLTNENSKKVSKDKFDNAVNDMLNNGVISTVEEVSALMKLRALIY